MNQSNFPTAETLNLTNCDREPIHIPGSIQPHGILIALNPSDLTIIQLSNNTEALLGYQPQDLLEKNLSQLLNPQQVKTIQKCLEADFNQVNPLKLEIQQQHFNGIVHRSLDKTIILELEPTDSTTELDFFSFHNLIKKPLDKIQNASNLTTLSQIIVQEIKRITGFDRVMIYRFNSEDAGKVIAEAKAAELTPYLGLYYPSSDIPKQARELYFFNLLRIIPDANYQPAQLTPLLNPITNAPLDLSLSVLRSVSPIHVEYLNNMGVTASMSISLLKDRQLWGLIACHHSTPKYISYETRTICEFLGQIMSLELTAKENVEIGRNGDLKISPRKSFELWQETVQLKALPWLKCEIEAAIELRSNIFGIVLRKAEELAAINQELTRSNSELDAFAYVASHDLKEPLRGIHNYSSFLIEDYGSILNEDGVSKLQTLMRLAQRMENLINSLLHYSRLGRVELILNETDLNELLNTIIETIKISFKEQQIDISIPHRLPIIKCDRIQLGELFTNLITNAIKYNDKPIKSIEIGWQQEETLPHQSYWKFYVKDNGIGIREKHQEVIFRIFKRLHPANCYGGGTGAGLTIAQKIVERHHGKIWVESTYGQGSSFYFTIPQ
ncbi:Multi-sensor Signal Transduction Histidine Kinase [Stanieria sp. NIES-3757]|nr:Multi-sensor Signal Transduction Histidine Kinase [Stanieria sp. NIES-3757]